MATVAGARVNGRSGASVRVDYAVLVKEIKPWPPSPSLCSLQSVLIHWENDGGRNSGSTKSIVPVLGSGGGNGDGRIVFNEAFKLSARLQRDLSAKSGNSDVFVKNLLEFNLYEPRRDSISKGQLIGTAIVNLADYGIVKEPVDISVSINCKRNVRNTCQPALYVRIQQFDEGGRNSLQRVNSVASAESGSVSTLGNEEHLDEVDSTFSEDEDDVRSNSSGRANGALRHSEASSASANSRSKENGDGDVSIHGIRGNSTEENGTHDELLSHGTGLDSLESERPSLSIRKGIPSDDRSKAVKFTEVPSLASEGVKSDRLREDDKDLLLYAQGARTYNASRRKDEKVYPKDKKSYLLEAKVQQMEHKIRSLEGELSEAATMEAALFSVVAEHGGSTSKVYTPARRLSRFYRHACGHPSNTSRMNAARSIISGLIFVSRASGSDVPRLTYWLSNSVMLRAIVRQTILKEKTSSEVDALHAKKGNKPHGKPVESQGIYEFMCDLENVEGWIFSRIVESLWWQSLAPHMQSSAAKSVDRRASTGPVKGNRKVKCTNELDQVDVSMEVWKKAFKDACERLCPVRGGGHECGCQPVLAKLVMEQLVTRLDVAMFNAILRESCDEIPTDPLSDPISDPSVLPIPPGRYSFRAGALLKNAIGNWSRWLTNLFGLEEDESREEDDCVDVVARQDISLKLFRLLNSLSDLMMLPKDMLFDKSLRKGVCPLFGESLIKRVLYNFVPDEFCPDPVPDSLLDSLDNEDASDEGEELVNHHPFKAPSPLYQPPSAASIIVIAGESGSKSELRRSRSSLIDKALTSDDELDELNSPWSSMLSWGSLSPTVSGSKPSPLKTNRWNKQHAIRYDLLRDIWTNCE
ncbi:hypothetical protein MLD38_000118 [Melastoma candidum]|uniref:Uncharacterized protein n=1 Tax=Melastoma candidum TaxID=119954 RepID=A0ACB9S8C4_9MYRT|nr:hypothetical protein MLD38_000118 [Melastoma candidum]